MSDQSPILFLENDIASIEDKALLVMTAARAGLMEDDQRRAILTSGLMRNMSNLRDYLRGSYHFANPSVDLADHSVGTSLARGAKTLRLQMIRDWCQHSRASYVITDELRSLLFGMSFGDLAWEDIVFPHQAFALSFESPLVLSVTEWGTFECCGMLISWTTEQGSDELVMLIQAYDKGHLGYRRLGVYEKTKIRSFQHNDKKILAASDAFMPRIDALQSKQIHIPAEAFVQLRIADTNMRLVSLTSAQNEVGIGARNDARDELTMFCQLIAGFCFYLQTLPSGSPHRSAWTGVRNPGESDPKAITNGADICLITSSVTLTAEERRTFDGEGQPTGRALSAHSRRGHFRRAAGTGNDPNAPKVILVRPTMVRRDRLQPGELVGGAHVKVKAP